MNNNENTLIDLVKCFPDRNWNWRYLSSNSNMEVEMILESLLLFPWSFRDLSSNYNVNAEFVEMFIDRDWDFRVLSGRICAEIKVLDRSFDFEFVRRHANKPWNWNIILSNIDLADVEKHMHAFKWNLFYMNYRRDISFELIDRYPDVPWSFSEMSRLLQFNLELVKQNKNLDWSWHSICYNNNLDMQFVRKYMLDKPNICWKAISANSGISMKDISENQDLPWDFYDGVSRNPNLTLEFLKTKFGENWNFDLVSGQDCLTCEFINSNMALSWNWKKISRNIYVSEHLLEKYKHFPWDYDSMSLNKHITFSLIKKYIARDWNFSNLSRNEFNQLLFVSFDYEYYEKRKDKTWTMCNMISDELMVAAWHPSRFVNWCICTSVRSEFNCLN